MAALSLNNFLLINPYAAMSLYQISIRKIQYKQMLCMYRLQTMVQYDILLEQKEIE